jgi:lipid II isoglutaminyl synthase (glutamine-hydrolysing)
MVNLISILIGKSIIFLSSSLNLGRGSTWPGHIALKLNPNFSREILEKSSAKKIVIAGTNGKTTTGKLINTIFSENGRKILRNSAGANLSNGLASTLIRGSSILGKFSHDYLVFESDENALPQILEQMTPDYVVCLDLFRDQLDRYGEIDTIAKKWSKSFEKLSPKTTLILNADDPEMAFLSKGTKAKSKFFGLDPENNKSATKHGADSIFCPKCSSRLEFKSITFSHLGNWSCPSCGLKRPKTDLSSLDYYPLYGTYNRYNSLAAALLAKLEEFDQKEVQKAFKKFKPAFGRQEEIDYKGKKVILFLSKNPTSFNESLSTISELKAKNILVVLNDRIPDGLDVSWIWDIDFEHILDKTTNIAISGDRVYDMALRLKYADTFTHVEPDLQKAIDSMVENLDKKEKLFILPNYSAMLDSRKILLGRKLL